MKLSKLFTKTSKLPPSDEPSKNAQLLIKAGLIDKTMAGVYAFLPIGLRVLNKIENIVRDEMNAIGSQEMLMNALNPKKLWTDTNRWENVDILFKIKSQTDNDYALACSHEEQVTPLVKQFVKSWKDIPVFDPKIGFYDVSKEGVKFNPTRKTVHLIIRNPKTDKYLVIDNRDTHSASDFDFYPVGGGIEPGETFYDTLVREVREETGIEADKILSTSYLGLIDQKFHCGAQVGFDEVNKHILSQMFYVEIDSELEGVCDPEKANFKETTVWLNKHQIQSILPGFQYTLNNWDKLIDEVKYPLATYQIQTKFRDELRSKSGLLRGREFRMKDMYDFHQNYESLDAYYELVKMAYSKAYARMGIIAVATEASGGIFTTNPSHEFQAICSAGEDKIYKVPSLNLYFNEEMAPVKARPWTNLDEEEKPLEDILTEGITGVDALAEYLKISTEQITKTLFYQTQDGKLVAACVRGNYKINEEKLMKVSGKHLKLASEHLVKKITGAEIGYAGLINLPSEVEVYIDDSCANRKNFKMGTNKTGYHSINVNFDRDIAMPDKFYDIKMIEKGDLYPETGEEYEVFVSAEVGNIFKLGTKYTKAIDFTYTDQNNEQQLVIMGCHGIGTTRCMAVIAEMYNDEKGLKWPESVAPFKYHLVTHINKKDESGVNEKIMEIARKVYRGELVLEFGEENTPSGLRPATPHEGNLNSVSAQNFNFNDDILWDDRDFSVGQKLNDADLLGCPWQIVITPRSLENGGVEVKSRKNGQSWVIAV
jgi:prolyl-tRNA synthetase